MGKRTNRSTVVALAAFAGVGAAGAALAAWNLTGSGTAEARAGSAVGLTVTSAGLPPDGLTPGNPTAVLLTVQNPNPFPVRVTGIALENLRSTRAGCDADDNVDVVNTAPLPAEADLTVPAGSDQRPATAKVTWEGPLRMVADPANACQGAPFTFNVRLDAVSAAS